MDKKAIPKIVKKIEHFVKDESGIITKEKILKTGAILGVSITLAQVAHGVHGTHANTLSEVQYDAATDTATATHSHNIPSSALGH